MTQSAHHLSGLVELLAVLQVQARQQLCAGEEVGRVAGAAAVAVDAGPRTPPQAAQPRRVRPAADAAV